MADGPHDSPDGRTGRVTSTIRGRSPGEVMVGVRGGTERFYAYALDPSDTFSIGDTVMVVDYQPPRSVTVVAWV